ncbi:TlpA disulfide reductase family protein [Flavivirga sp. 57AJ16]|uniref:TlpA disulfide reductase family protein n=1 Tax=Flavivirga sp. 57AJ16 TaxID=3025307 RepID=UPI0023658B76|nr:TlpA disulfide reductase family protein [Flavivirga sp. 57AJ16]MDD7886922.1 TlpA disulfide reductase family protein [Flavivirga sp. 57AJ16]
MKKIIFIAFSLLLLGACKNKEKGQLKEDGYVINGEMESLEPESIAVLSYKQNDSTVTDTSLIEDGKFTFTGKLMHPANATISVRHGKTFPKKYQERDVYNFFIDNSAMQISAVNLIKEANLKGSVLTDESIEIENQISPLTDEIQALFKRMDGRNKEEKLITYDTIQVFVDSIRAVAHQFIISHPNSYVALQRFSRHRMPKNFDPIKADEEFNELFDKNLRQTPIGKSIAKKIAIAKKSQIGIEAIDFTQTTINGEEFKLSSLRGKYVLVDFWAAWCKPCRAENPFVVKAYNKYKDQNFEIVGVSLDADKASWEKAIEKDGLPWIHVSDLKYWKNEVALQYGVNSVPANYLISPEGIIVAKNLRGEALAQKLSEIFDKS